MLNCLKLKFNFNYCLYVSLLPFLCLPASQKVSQIASRETKEATNHGNCASLFICFPFLSNFILKYFLHFPHSYFLLCISSFLANVKTTGKNEKNGKKLENTTKESTMKSGACEKNDTLRNVQNAHEEYILEEKQDEKYKKEENTAKNVIMEEKEEDVGESNDVRNDLDLNWNKDKKDKALQAISNADAVGMMDDKRDKNKGQNEKNESTNKDMMNDNGMNDEKNKMLETLSYENEVNMEKKPDDTKKNAKHAIENEKMKESCKNAGKNNNVGKNEKNAVLQVLCRNEEDMNVKKEKKRNIEEKSMEYEMEEDIETKECAEKSSDVKNVENKKKDENERMNKGEKEDTQEEFMQIENEERNKRNKEEKKESEETNAVEKILSF